MRRYLFSWLLCAALLLPAIALANGAVSAVSFTKLLVAPESYKGMRIEVTGYLANDQRLYLTKDHAQAFDGLSSVMVSDTDEGEISASNCVGSYVRIRGTFEEVDTLSFIIKDVDRVYRPDLGKTCWAR